MSSTLIAAAVKLLESLPEQAQEAAVEHLREYISDIEDDCAWDARFERSQPQLVEAARRAKVAIAQGESKTLELEQL